MHAILGGLVSLQVLEAGTQTLEAVTVGFGGCSRFLTLFGQIVWTAQDFLLVLDEQTVS